MTAIVSWLCKDGVVIGSDSAITFGSGNLFTIEQTGEKISIIRDKIIVAGSGAVGHQQRFCDIVQTAYDQNLFRKKHMDVGRVLSQNMNNDLAATRAERGKYCALLAYGSDDGFHLCEFVLSDFQPEWKDKSLNFASIGCGQLITDPFLGFMKRIFWNDSDQPTVAQAKFITFWTLFNVCELSPGGVKGPVHMTQLMKDGTGHSVVAEIGPAELEEHVAIMKDAISHVGKFKDQMTGKAAVPIPSMGTK